MHMVHVIGCMVSKYQDGDSLDVFLEGFERLCGLNQIEVTFYPHHLFSLLQGKPLDTYAQVSDKD